MQASKNHRTLDDRIVFVIPTYNESENIVPLLSQLADLHDGANVRFLVMDDASPDGTAAVAREMAAADSRIRVVDGVREGLGMAYRRGFSYALDTLAAEVVVQMDADFSHDPADSLRLLRRLDKGADVVLGSRYVAGGSLDPGWPGSRRMLSRCANTLARCVGGLRDVADCTAGFKAMRAAALRRALAGLGDVRGYLFQPALLNRLLATGASVAEMPIHFHPRRAGSAKLGVRQLAQVFPDLCALRAGAGTKGRE